MKPSLFIVSSTTFFGAMLFASRGAAAAWVLKELEPVAPGRAGRGGDLFFALPGGESAIVERFRPRKIRG